MQLDNKNMGSSERRQVTILNCDIVGSTRITEELDPEDLSMLMLEFETVFQRCIKEYAGYTAGSTGDGFEVYFGFPMADEYSAPNALLSAIAIIDSLTSVRSIKNTPLQVRIGVATGVIVSKGALNHGIGKDVFGLPAPMAARLQEAAQPNEILVDSNTKNLCWEFEYRPMLPRKLKNLSGEIEHFRLLGTKPPQSRIEYRLNMPSPFVGRDEEKSILASRWKSCVDELGNGVLVFGEPGIGKSRLIYECTKNLIEQGDVISMLVQCSPRFSTSPFQPWVQLLEQQFSQDNFKSSSYKRETIKAHIKDRLKMTDEFVAILLSMMNISTGDDEHILDISPQHKARIMREGLVNFIQTASTKSPVLIIIEDLHWADPSTYAVVEDLLSNIESYRILLLLSSRVEHNELDRFPTLSKIRVVRLNNDQSLSFVKMLSENITLNLELVESIRSRTDGIPLYIEEVTRSILTKLKEDHIEKDEAKTKLEIPGSLYNLLMARLDKLEGAKEIAQIASTLGREFEFSLLEEISGLDGRIVNEFLAQLIDTHLVTKRSRSGNTIFSFRHALIQEAAYESLLKSSRIKIHAKAATSLRKKQEDGDIFQPEVIAYHYQEAGELEDAFTSWVDAGSKRLGMGATAEAVKILECAKISLDEVVRNNRIPRTVLDYYIVLGKSLNASEGAKSIDAQNAFSKAADIANEIGDIDTQVHALDSEFGILFNSGIVENAIMPADEMLRLGRSENHKVAEISGLQSLGMIKFVMGDFNGAKQYLKQSVVDASEIVFGLNSYPSLALMYLAWTQFLLGEKEEAKLNCIKSIRSGKLESPYSYGVSLGNGCYYYQFSNEKDKLKSCSEELIELSSRKGQLMWLSRGLFFRHWLRANDKKCIDSLFLMIEEVQKLLDAKEEIETTYYLGLIAETQINLGFLDEAESSLKKALDISEINCERFFLSQLYRIYGDLEKIKTSDSNNRKTIEYYCAANNIANEQCAENWMKKTNAIV